MRSMHTLKSGEKGRVVSLHVNARMKQRLFDIGLIEGTEVVSLQKSPLGDPTAYFICGSVIVLRKQDAAMIFLESE